MDKGIMQEGYGKDKEIAAGHSQRLGEGKEACNSSTANQAGI